MEAVIRRSEQGECPVSENTQCEGLETGFSVGLERQPANGKSHDDVTNGPRTGHDNCDNRKKFYNGSPNKKDKSMWDEDAFSISSASYDKTEGETVYWEIVADDKTDKVSDAIHRDKTGSGSDADDVRGVELDRHAAQDVTHPSDTSNTCRDSFLTNSGGKSDEQGCIRRDDEAYHLDVEIASGNPSHAVRVRCEEGRHAVYDVTHPLDTMNTCKDILHRGDDADEVECIHQDQCISGSGVVSTGGFLVQDSHESVENSGARHNQSVSGV